MSSLHHFPFVLVISHLFIRLLWFLGMSWVSLFPPLTLPWFLGLLIPSFVPVFSMTTRSCYLYLFSERIADPHCVENFAPSFGSLYWPTTWRSLSLFDLDHKVIDLNWKIAHGVLYTAEHLSSFGLPVPLQCFCGAPVEILTHLLFACPLAQSVLSLLQSLLFPFSPMSLVLLPHHSLFGVDPSGLCATSRIFGYMLNACKFFIWLSRNDFRFCGLQPGTFPVRECEGMGQVQPAAPLQTF